MSYFDDNEDYIVNKKSQGKIPKKKKTAYEKRKFFMKIAGWIMAIVMIFGTLISIFGMLIYA